MMPAEAAWDASCPAVAVGPVRCDLAPKFSSVEGKQERGLFPDCCALNVCASHNLCATS